MTTTIHCKSGNFPATIEGESITIEINGRRYECDLAACATRNPKIATIIHQYAIVPTVAADLRKRGVDPDTCIIFYARNVTSGPRSITVSAAEDIEVLAPAMREAQAARRARWDAERAAEERAEAVKARIYLSSRGWGDFAAVEWVGDITRPAAEIEAECARLLASAHDVDTPLSAAEIAAKVAAAKDEHRAKYMERITALRARIAKAEALGDKIRSAADQAAWERNYNNVVNEGGDGYVPHQISREELAELRAKLARAERDNPWA